MDWIQFPMHAL